MAYLYHLSRQAGWEPNLAPASLAAEGFVHLCTLEQLLPTAERWFAEEQRLKLLLLDDELLGPALRWEDSYGHGQAFPHYYGALPANSVRAVLQLERAGSGEPFLLPYALRALSTPSPLLEPPDLHSVALIEPRLRFPKPVLPKRGLLCYFEEVWPRLAALPGARELSDLGSAIGPKRVLLLRRSGVDLFVACPGVGGPLAAAGLEELIALGGRTFMLCGGAGSLQPGQPLGALVLPDRAYRDEGVSHHYRPPSAAIAVPPLLHKRLAAALDARGVPYRSGASWTIDALYRETPERVARRRHAGCLTVEMELASLLAVAEFRDCELGALLYCGDDLSTEEWDFREWTSAHTVRERLVELSLDLLTAVD